MLGTVAAAIRSPELKEITWRSEMKKRCVVLHFSSLLSHSHYLCVGVKAAGRVGPEIVLLELCTAGGVVGRGGEFKVITELNDLWDTVLWVRCMATSNYI